MRGTFAGCYAQAGRQSAQSKAQSERRKALLLMNFLLRFLTVAMQFALCSLLSHLITLSALAKTFGGIVSPVCCLEIDDQL
jgi:hypothetical protein